MCSAQRSESPPPDSRAPAPAALASDSGSPPPRTARLHATLWLVFLLIPLIEVARHFVVRSRVPAEEDWIEAIEHARERWQERDLILSAPGWTDPILRHHGGDLLPLAATGRSDLASFERLWLLSIRGRRSPEAPARAPDEERRFGRVHLMRWDLGPSPVLADLTDQWRSARVTLGLAEPGGAGAIACPLRRMPLGMGGLGQGPMLPIERFVCDPRRPHLGLAATVTEDLELRPRRCLWQHPEGERPMRATFEDLPLGSRIVLHGGLYYESERNLVGGPVDVRLEVNGEEVGHMVHRDGDGWKRMEALTGAPPGARGAITIDVRARDPRHRTFCWAATTRLEERREP